LVALRYFKLESDKSVLACTDLDFPIGFKISHCFGKAVAYEADFLVVRAGTELVDLSKVFVPEDHSAEVPGRNLQGALLHELVE